MTHDRTIARFLAQRSAHRPGHRHDVDPSRRRRQAGERWAAERDGTTLSATRRRRRIRRGIARLASPSRGC